jgi:hypothetical protein
MENNCMEIKDLPELIRRNEYYNYISYIENFEDTLQKVLNSKNNSSFKNDDKIFLWPINEYINKDLFKNMINFDYNDFGIKFRNENDISGIVVTGPYIRSCLININFDEENKDKKTKISIKKSIYLFRYKDCKWGELIENIDEYTESDNEYIFELEDKTICLVKKKYSSTSQILLQHDYIKRIGWENGTFYVSSRFLIEYQKHKKAIMSKACDPILNIPYDPLGIYCVTESSNKNILKMIDYIDLEELMKLSIKNIIKLYNSKTLIEICIDKYNRENNIMLLEQLEKMIVYLMQFNFKRPPSLYAKIVNINKKNEILYQFICDNEKNEKNIYKDLRKNLDQDENIKNIDDINNFIIEHYIKEDNTQNLIDFLGYIQQKLNKKILEKIVKYNSKNVIKELIENKIVDDYMSYYLILMSGNIDLVDIINFDMDSAINFLKDIVANGISESFNYMIENDKSIATYVFDDNKNIFHMIKMRGNYDKIISKMFECYPELINICDKNGETPLIYHSKNNPKLINSFLEYDDHIDLTIRDNEGNNCLHFLCKHDEQKILKNILKKYPELINMPNSKSEYPIMVCCKNKLEGMFYVLKNNGANLNVKDLHGNTVYHYICSNSICLGIEIKNIPNFFGVTPKNYCVLSPKYYHFVEVE